MIKDSDRACTYVPREISGKPSTARVEKRLSELWSADLRLDSERCRLYTEYMKKHWTESLYTRQGGALKYVLSNMTPVIKEDELVVGCLTRYTRGAQLYPEYNSQWIREAVEKTKRPEDQYVEGHMPTEWKEESRITIFKVTPEDRKEIIKAIDFWDGKDWVTVAKNVIKDQMTDFDLIEKWVEQLLVIAFMWDVPEGRVHPDYSKAIEHGLLPIIDRCLAKMKEIGPTETKEKLEKYDFYKGTVLALEGALAFADNYAREAEKLAVSASGKRKDELLEIARICRRVPRYGATSFREAVQSFWFIHCMFFIELNGRGISPGRFDQYMYRYFKNDIDSGQITTEGVLELLELLRVKSTEFTKAHSAFMGANLVGTLAENWTVGGIDRYGKGADNELSALVLQAGINAKTHQPTLSVRWTDKLSHEFRMKTIDAIKAGTGYPAVFNDELAMKRLMSVNGVSLEDARDWAPVGCIDMNIPGKRTPGWCINNFNATKALELVLNGGINPNTGDKLLDINIDAANASYQEIKEEFKRVMCYVQHKQAQYWNAAMVVKCKMGLTLPFLSAFLDDCIERGLSCQEGGCRYNDLPWAITCGMINVTNSLAAIKQCVFEQKLFTIEQLKEAIKHDFKGNGYGEIHRQLLAAPKYGNDDDYVDLIATDLYTTYSNEFMKNLNWLGRPWQPSNLSIAVNVSLGAATGASPDGRKAGEPLADGSVSAHPGTDLNGPTALIKSAGKQVNDKLQSQLFNMKFHPSAIEGRVGSEKFIALLDSFCDLGCYHVQFNIVDANMLRDAQKHPENYPDLLVRIAGFTARWVELGPTVQEDIIRRTEYGEI